jgi:S-adenosylmethionine-diacylglycerol 3-amino-3-carboxypropyl transferase
LTSATKIAASRRLNQAVRRNRAFSTEGLREILFTLAFKGLVYPQIWEDPEVDMEALAITPDCHVVAIASGGCNVLSYLVADPGRITAVDLARAHVALNRLKLAAARHLPSWQSFYRFFGAADAEANVAAYWRFLKPHLDGETCDYWERRVWGRRRISMFSRNVYRHGLLGHFIGLGHLVARLHGVDLSKMLHARSLAEQRAFFETSLRPLFDKPLVRWATGRQLSLYGLGIPPAQYAALGAGAPHMATVLRDRVERLSCEFSLDDNYFAWQAFGRSYANRAAGPLPPYLKEAHFETIRARADRVEVLNRSFTEYLRSRPDRSHDRYVLLDAQDWMSDQQLNELWGEITRTARPGARVIFRTAAEPSLLPGRVDADVLGQWHYEAEQSRDLTRRDRSAIYGGFHLYVLAA